MSSPLTAIINKYCFILSIVLIYRNEFYDHDHYTVYGNFLIEGNGYLNRTETNKFFLIENCTF